MLVPKRAKRALAAVLGVGALITTAAVLTFRGEPDEAPFRAVTFVQDSTTVECEGSVVSLISILRATSKLASAAKPSQLRMRLDGGSTTTPARAHAHSGAGRSAESGTRAQTGRQSFVVASPGASRSTSRRFHLRGRVSGLPAVLSTSSSESGCKRALARTGRSWPPRQFSNVPTSRDSCSRVATAGLPDGRSGVCLQAPREVARPSFARTGAGQRVRVTSCRADERIAGY
jgi:hypothetical protein